MRVNAGRRLCRRIVTRHGIGMAMHPACECAGANASASPHVKRKNVARKYLDNQHDYDYVWVIPDWGLATPLEKRHGIPFT